MTDGGMNTLALRGLEEPAHASRGLEEPFFQLCYCVSFWFWREIGFGLGAQLLLRPEKKVLVVCLAGARSLLRPEKKSSSPLSGGCGIVITTGKKSSSRLLGPAGFFSSEFAPLHPHVSVDQKG